MTTDDLYDQVSTFRDTHDLPDPRYVTMQPLGPLISLHFNEPASTLGLDVAWHFLSASADKVTMSARTRIGDVAVSLIAPYGEVAV